MDIDDSTLPSPSVHQSCACGCGKAVKPGNKYVWGHSGGRLLAREYVVGSTGCWIWQGARTGPGYGSIRRTLPSSGRIYRQAHQWYYANAKGPVPPGKQLHHNCGVTLCVNPDHLSAESVREHQMMHRHGARSKFHGVQWDSGRVLWTVRPRRDSIRRLLCRSRCELHAGIVATEHHFGTLTPIQLQALYALHWGI